MGHTSSWLAFETDHLERVLAFLALQATDQRREVHVGPGLCLARRGRYWVVLADGPDLASALQLDDARAVGRWSPDAFFVRQSDFRMASTVHHATAGTVDWSVRMDTETMTWPVMRGQPPWSDLSPYLTRVRDLLPAERLGQLYELPVQVAEACVGFRHDAPTSDDGFVALVQQPVVPTHHPLAGISPSLTRLLQRATLLEQRAAALAACEAVLTAESADPLAWVALDAIRESGRVPGELGEELAGLAARGSGRSGTVLQMLADPMRHPIDVVKEAAAALDPYDRVVAVVVRALAGLPPPALPREPSQLPLFTP